MVFNIPEDILTDFVSESSGHWYEHRFRKGGAHEFFYKGMIVSQEGSEIFAARTEAERNGELQEKAYVEIAEIRFYGIQKHDLLFTPFIKTLLCCTFLYDAI